MHTVPLLVLLAACAEQPPDFARTRGIKGRVVRGTLGASAAEVWIAVDDDGDGNEDRRIATTSGVSGSFFFEVGELTDVDPGSYTVGARKGRFSGTEEIDWPGNGYLDMGEIQLEGSVDIAVVTGDYDAVEEIVDGLELPYTTVNGQTAFGFVDFVVGKGDLSLEDFDVVLVNCGVHGGLGASFDYVPFDEQATVAARLRSFVDGGGSLYASDWAAQAIEVAWPERFGFHDSMGTDLSGAAVGTNATVAVTTSDPLYVPVLGETPTVEFDLASWIVLDSVGDDVQAIVEGDAPLLDGTVLEDRPLAGRFSVLDADVTFGGRVVYTTFHNHPEGSITEAMDGLLVDFVLGL